MNKQVKVIARVEFKHSSLNGNPTYRVHFTDGTSALTKANAYVGYEIQNSQYYGVPVRVSFTSAGTISEVQLATEPGQGE